MALYPKISSVYHKILQVGCAILLVIAVLNLWFSGIQQGNDDLEQQFGEVGTAFVDQAAITAKVMIESGEREQLVKFVQSLTESDVVAEARLYDVTGQTIAASKGGQIVKDFYQSGEGADHNEIVPFIQEIRSEKLHGYMRVNLIKTRFTEELTAQFDNQYDLFQIMLILAALAGILFSRGVSGFGRNAKRLGTRK